MRGLVTVLLTKIPFSIQALSLIAIVIIALTRLSIHKKSSVLVAVGAGLLLLVNLVNFTISSMQANNVSHDIIRSMMSVFRVLNAIISAGGFGLMAWAALGDRESASTAAQVSQGS